MPRDLRRVIPIRRPRWTRGRPIADPVRSPTLVTARLVLRPHRMEDADAWYALETNPDVVRYLAWPQRTREESLRHLRDRTRHTRLERRNDFLALAVVREGELIGDVSLHLRVTEPEARVLEIGWILDPARQGKGYASEAAQAMLGLAFDRLAAVRVVARMDPRNEPSRLLAERLGFTEVPPGGGMRRMKLTADAYRTQHPRPAGPGTGVEPV